jgi:hypothetical protein
MNSSAADSLPANDCACVIACCFAATVDGLESFVAVERVDAGEVWLPEFGRLKRKSNMLSGIRERTKPPS